MFVVRAQMEEQIMELREKCAGQEQFEYQNQQMRMQLEQVEADCRKMKEIIDRKLGEENIESESDCEDDV